MLVRIRLAARKGISTRKPRASEARVAARKCPGPRLHPEAEAVKAVVVVIRAVVAVLRAAAGGVHENPASGRNNELKRTRKNAHATQNKV